LLSRKFSSSKRSREASNANRQTLTHRRQQSAEARPFLHPASGATQVFVDHDDVPETQLPGAFRQGILALFAPQDGFVLGRASTVERKRMRYVPSGAP